MTLVAATPQSAMVAPTPCGPTSSTPPATSGSRRSTRPRPGPGEALIRVTLTTICGTDVHIVKGEYPVEPGLIIGHEPVGVIEELGAGVTGYEVGERVLVGAITPCGQCHACLSGHLSQCGHGSGYEAIGGWRFGNTINGAQAEYLLVPNAQANLRQDPGRRHRRAGRPARRHRVDRLLPAPSPAASGSATRSSSSPRARSACARRPARKLMGATPRSSASTATRSASRCRGGWAPTSTLDFTKVDVVDGGQAPDRRDRRRRRDRGARDPGDVRERAALPAAGRDAVEPRRVLRQAPDPVRRVRGGPRRPPDRHDPLPGRQGADGPAASRRSSRAGSTRRRCSPIASRSTRSARRIGSSATASTAS